MIFARLSFFMQLLRIAYQMRGEIVLRRAGLSANFHSLNHKGTARNPVGTASTQTALPLAP